MHRITEVSKTERIRSVLSDGKKRFISELAGEAGLTPKQVICSIASLTTIEPRLAEADNGALFMVMGR